MTEEKKSYRVTDRRHQALETPVEPDSQEPRVVEQQAPPGPVSFAAFIMSLGAQASLLLGGVEGTPPDLNGAKWLISILEMLKEKTDGRLTPEEADVLDGILYELRLGYVQRARAGSE
jgi:hypothetical protein